MAKKKTISTPKDRKAELNKARTLKMARSAHAYVRGNTMKFYEWLDAVPRADIPQGPAIWICGDCHVGNLGPVASAGGKVEIQIRDFDQTVIGNPAHDLIRLGLSMAMAVRSSDLPGVNTALMIEQMMAGYTSAFEPDKSDVIEVERPDAVHVALKEASLRTFKHLAQERLDGRTARIPLGKRFWEVSEDERVEIEAMCKKPEIVALVTALSHRPDGAKVKLLDVAYWMKGCSSLGKLRYAVMLDVGKGATLGRDLCLLDMKESVKAAAPRYDSSDMPHEYAQRVVEGARNLSPFLGKRMIATRLAESSVFLRELLPQDLKLEIKHISPAEARRTASYLAAVVGKAHARQLSLQDRDRWREELRRTQGKSFEAPSWLWRSMVELVGTHEQGYLDHCRRFALASSRELEQSC